MKTYRTSAFFLGGTELLADILYFPIWWYSAGLKNSFVSYLNNVGDFNAFVGFTIWVKNIGTPLFGATDFTNRLISFILRVVNIIIRGIIFLIAAAFLFLRIVAWVALPPILIYLILLA